MTVGRSENWSDDLWIGEMGLSAKNGKTVDRRNEGGSEKNEIGVRNVFKKLTVSVDWIGAWIEVDRSGSERFSEFAWSGSELVSFPVWSGLELGSWADRSLDRSGSEWFSSSASSLDRSGSERFPSSASSLDRYWASEWIGAWLRRVVSGSEYGSEQWRLDRAVRVWEARACERGEETNWSENND